MQCLKLHHHFLNSSGCATNHPDALGLCRDAAILIQVSGMAAWPLEHTLRKLAMQHEAKLGALCRASNGGAVHVVGTSPARVTFNSITGCSFDNNTANASSGSAPPFTGDGGALFLDGGVTSLLGTSITGNSAGGRGGGVAYVHQCFNFSSVPGKALIAC